MNDIPPFSISDGTMFEPEGTGSDQRRHEAKRALVAQMDKYPGWSRPASDCLNEMTDLARQFNHGTVGIAHLIVAMTLVPSAMRQLQLRNIDVDTAFRTAMMSLIDMERVKPGDPIAKASSGELNSLLNRAGDIAENRDLQDITVGDLLTALSSLPADAAAARPIRSGNKINDMVDLQSEIADSFAMLDRRLNELAIPVQQPVIDFQARNDLSEIKTSLQSLSSQLYDLARQLAATRLEEPSEQHNENKDPVRATDKGGWTEQIPWLRRG